MARTPVVVRIDLERIKCHDEGDGIGSAEPYLWVAFFKVDGTTVSVSPAFTLEGEATVEFSAGSHGNLPNDDVDEGEVIAIPGALGQWSTRLEPIGFQDPPDGIDDVGGAVGVVAVLMEEDNVTDDGAEAGHQALNAAVRDAINQIVATRTLTNQEVTDEELAAFEDGISDIVSDAVSAQQNIFEDIWSWLNKDDTIGFKAFVFSHDDLTPNTVTEFSHRWRNEGDWEIFGTVTTLDVCPARALDGVFTAENGRAKGGRLDGLRAFRDGTFRNFEGLDQWWQVLQRNAPAVVRALYGDDSLRGDARSLFDATAAALGGERSAFGSEQVQQATRVADALARSTRSRRLRVDAMRAVDTLQTISACDVDGVAAALAASPPSRRPKKSEHRIQQTRPNGGSHGKDQQ